MTTTRTAHQDCTHEATKAARTSCRKDRASGLAAAREALDIITARWALTGASNFTDYKGSDPLEATIALLAYFGPSGDEAQDARRRANGYIITTSAATIRSIILRRNS
jgi:hypothetical protein